MSVVGAATPDHPPLGGFGPRMERFARDFVHAAVFNMGYGGAEASNGSAAFSDKHKIREERRLSPMSNTEVVPVDNLAVRPNKLRERFFHGRLPNELCGCHDRVAHRTRVGSASARELADILISRNTGPVARLP